MPWEVIVNIFESYSLDERGFIYTYNVCMCYASPIEVVQSYWLIFKNSHQCLFSLYFSIWSTSFSKTFCCGWTIFRFSPHNLRVFPAGSDLVACLQRQILHLHHHLHQLVVKVMSKTGIILTLDENNEDIFWMYLYITNMPILTRVWFPSHVFLFFYLKEARHYTSNHMGRSRRQVKSQLNWK